MGSGGAAPEKQLIEAFDAVVVGAGPAGSSAALVLARAGKRVALLERGPFPGSKNMYGGVVYGRILDRLIPRWWEEIPVQRWVTRRATMLLTETQSLTIDFRSQRWSAAPYNGCTTFRPDFDSWLSSKAEDAGATLITSTTATGLLRDESGRVRGVHTDRPDGDIEAPITIACDGVNSFIAKEAGLYLHPEPDHFTLGVKEVLALPRAEIDARFALTGDEGADFEILGGTGGVPGGAFLYTNAESISVGVVLQLSALGASKRRPEEFIDAVKGHAAIAPLVAGGELKEHSAHLIPEGGYDAMPGLATDGLLIAGDAAGLCLAAGIWLEGVNFAIGSGSAAAETAIDALRAGDTSATTLSSYRRRIEANFVLRDHKKLRHAPNLVLSDRVQHAYPNIVCDMVESLFTVDNPRPKVGGLRATWRELRKSNVRLRDAAKDAWTVLRTYG
jgi:electron transfer flavoprotein-quinone oxidoreductase